MADQNTPTNIRTIRHCFVGGEISRELIGRVDLEPVQNSLDTCRNFIITPHGTSQNRPGFQFVNEVKNSANFTRLIPFSFSDSQSFIIELGAGYFRAHGLGASLSPGTVAAYNNATAYVIGDLASSSGVNYYCVADTTGHAPPNASYWHPMPEGIYEVPNPYATHELSSINIAQSGDVLTLVHQNHPPREFSRYANTRWILRTINFNSPLPAPTGLTGLENYFFFTGTGYYKNHFYTVSALDSFGEDESPLATVPNGWTMVNDLTQSGNFTKIGWNAVTGASYYKVYKQVGETWGYIGQTTGLSFTDDNVIPDISKTPPMHDTLFASAGNYPATVCYYEQRRFFANTLNQPMNIWATRSSSNNNMGYSVPSLPNDALRFKIAAQRANAIKHLMPSIDIMAMTASTEWRIYSSADALTPTSFTIKPQSQNGVGNVSPVLANNYILYPQSQGGHIREMSYQDNNGGYVSNDVCLLAPHLFDNKTIFDMTFTRSPIPTLWAINTDGQLLGLTYVPNQEVWAWHKHDTINGLFESICAITENGYDVLYAIVKRTIGGATKRYIEFLHDRNFTNLNDAFFVDSGLTYTGTAATTISGLGHLEGETVSILADGEVRTPLTVTDGAINMACPATKVHVGLPITADMITNPIFLPQDSALGQGRVKNINKVWIRVHNTGYKIVDDNKEIVDSGPDSTKLMKLKVKIYDNLI